MALTDELINASVREQGHMNEVTREMARKKTRDKSVSRDLVFTSIRKKKRVDNGRIRTYACEHNAYDVSEEIAGHRLNHSATLSYL